MFMRPTTGFKLLTVSFVVLTARPEIITHTKSCPDVIVLYFVEQFDELSAPVAQEVEFIFIRLNVLREVR